MTIKVEHNLNEWHDACGTALFQAQQEVKVLLAKGEMLAAVVQGAREDFVKVPYGASHEDVAAINDWHKMAAEALNEWGREKQTPTSVRLFKAKERMSELSIESAIASAKASKLQEQLREAEAEVAALEKELEEQGPGTAELLLEAQR